MVRKVGHLRTSSSVVWAGTPRTNTLFFRGWKGFFSFLIFPSEALILLEKWVGLTSSAWLEACSKIAPNLCHETDRDLISRWLLTNECNSNPIRWDRSVSRLWFLYALQCMLCVEVILNIKLFHSRCLIADLCLTRRGQSMRIGKPTSLNCHDSPNWDCFSLPYVILPELKDHKPAPGSAEEAELAEYHRYLQELASLSLENIIQQPNILADKQQLLRREMDDLAFKNYKVFIQSANTSQTITTEMSNIGRKLDSLISHLPNLTNQCQEFCKTYAKPWTQLRAVWPNPLFP